MKYNTTIENDDALPIPYVIIVGKDELLIKQLYKGNAILLDVNYITSNKAGAFILVGSFGGEPSRVIIEPSPNLLIKYANESIPPTPSNPEKV
jgi:hypothetical protein